MHNDSTANNTQLVRHQLQFASAADADQLLAARELLTDQGFLVDQLTPNEAVVASAQGTDPDWAPIKEGFSAAGLPDYTRYNRRVRQSH